MSTAGVETVTTAEHTNHDRSPMVEEMEEGSVSLQEERVRVSEHALKETNGAMPNDTTQPEDDAGSHYSLNGNGARFVHETGSARQSISRTDEAFELDAGPEVQSSNEDEAVIFDVADHGGRRHEESEEDDAITTPTPEKLTFDTTISSDPSTDSLIASPLSCTPTNIAAEEALVSPVSPNASHTPTDPVSPIIEPEAHRSRDSMASIALSESSLDYDHLSAQQVEDVLATPRVSSMRHLRRPSSLEIMADTWQAPVRQSTLFDTMHDEPLDSAAHGTEDDVISQRDSVQSVQSIKSVGFDRFEETESLRSNSTTSASFTLGTQSRSSSVVITGRTSGSSSDDLEVDWSQLDKNEEQEKEDKDLPEGVEDESTAFLLARLEHENAKFTADPKSSVHGTAGRGRSASRPLSMGHLKKLVQDRNAPSFRYSLAPDTSIPEELPAMTELEFWAALVQDYPSTAVRLPTLTTTKIRSGIPPPLRGVVWASISGARDKALEDSFDNLLGEKSPYEGIINKDVGRSFPGVELFRDADGEGQRMLGRVLKCFSLHDKDIGYCQGLGFLVGPLLMNMGEREAFCVLVRLMEHYALRPSFLPSLSGLHMRIYQFSSLLRQHHPELSEHFAVLGVEPAYVSQWFLSCFAVTCPLSMLFRIYDVIFAEGANETVMRVALALIRRNEAKMLASSEFEEVMQLLLGRSIWDSYGCNADDLVDDFTSLGNIITHTRLAELEKEFDNQSTEGVGQSAGFLPDVQAAASRFLGRLWAPAHNPNKSTSTLSPHTAEKDGSTGSSYHARKPSFLLRRSPSKQSISTVNETEGSSTNGSIASTAPTEVGTAESTRDSTTDVMSLRSKTESIRTPSQTHAPFHKEQQDLHTQIEDLLMAMSEMQREHAELTAMLQREREERGEDHRAVKRLIDQLDPDKAAVTDVSEVQDRRRTMPPPPRPKPVKERPASFQGTVASRKPAPEELDELVQRVEQRLQSNTRFSTSFETKAQLRSTLVRTREQLVAAQEHSRELAQRSEVAETSLLTFQNESEDLRAEVKELRDRVSEEFKTRQKLEYTIQEMKAEVRSMGRRDRLSRISGVNESPTKNDASIRQSTSSFSSVPTNVISSNGLRELKLGRRDSSSSVQSLRPRSRMSSQPPSPPELHHANTMPASLPTLDITPYIDDDEDGPESPFSVTSATTPTKPASASSTKLNVPAATGTFAARTSSLATQEVFATPEHESVPEEALLLELVNAKTAEAQAKQEVDEVRRAMNVQKRRHEEALARMQADFESTRAEIQRSAEQARIQTEKMKAELEQVRLDATKEASSLITPSVSLPGTPTGTKEDYGFTRSPDQVLPQLEIKKSAPSSPGTGTPTPPATTATSTVGGGWFWSRRTASTAKAVLDNSRKDGTA